MCAISRAQKKDVAFICGSDEHGVAISIRAKKEGVTPKVIIDKYDAMIKTAFQQLGVSFDNYSRTSAPIHHKTAAEFFTQMHADGKFIGAKPLNNSMTQKPNSF